MRASKGAVRFAQIPKTIDNDLPLPGAFRHSVSRLPGTWARSSF